MARYACPQCGRRFGSVGEVLNHTQRVHAGESATEIGAEPEVASRSMPEAQPGPVATERASEAEFEVEPLGGNGSGSTQPAPRPSEDEEGEEKQNPALGTVIALIVIALIIILNIIGGGE